jgi:hypothetical protein
MIAPIVIKTVWENIGNNDTIESTQGDIDPNYGEDNQGGLPPFEGEEFAGKLPMPTAMYIKLKTMRINKKMAEASLAISAVTIFAKACFVPFGKCHDPRPANPFGLECHVAGHHKPSPEDVGHPNGFLARGKTGLPPMP